MTLIIGVRFRKSGKVYYFDPTGMEIKRETMSSLKLPEE